MTVNNVISGDPFSIEIRENATKYEIMQETIRQTALRRKQQTNNGKKVKNVTRRHDIRIIEK